MTDNADDMHRLVTDAIVVGADGSPASHSAISWAARRAARQGRKLVIAHGMNATSARTWLVAYKPVVDEAMQVMRTHGEAVLLVAQETAAEAAGDLEIHTLLRDEGAAQLLTDLSATAAMVVLGARPGGVLSHLGSTLAAVAAHGSGPVAAVHENSEDATGPVVVGVDGSPVSEAAVALAFAEAADRDAELVAVHTWSDLTFAEYSASGFVEMPIEDLHTAERAVLAERLAGWQEQYPQVTVRRKVYASAPRHHLLEWSERAQLVVVGSRGRGGFRGLLLGSTSRSLVQQASCPVIVTRPS